MRLSYLTPLTFPSRYVNRLQVMKMAAAFTKQTDFALYIAKSHIPSEELFGLYNIHNQFAMGSVGRAMWLRPRRFWQARLFLPVLAAADEGVVWYARDVLLADWLLFFSARFRNRYFFELHTFSRFSENRYRRVLAGARGIITTNEEKKRISMDRFGIPEKNILVAPNGVDVDEFESLKNRKREIRKELGIEENTPLVVYAGTDAKNYGTDVLRKAAVLIHATVEIVSGRARNEALKYMAAADVLAAPYLSADDHFRKYMSPIKLREYMAMERPLVVSDLPSVRAFVPTEEYAYFAKPGDHKDLARAITEALEKKEEAARRAQNACELTRKFSWDARAERIIEFIRKAV